MELGEKLRNARLEAGLSQRQLCDGIVTRNMLSLIEHGSANPSMETLKLLAARLGKSVSYFLEEEAVVSPNQTLMETVRRHFDDGEFGEADRALEAYRAPDPVFDREKQLLQTLSRLQLAQKAIAEERFPYALELLGRAEGETAYCNEELNCRRLLLLGRLPGQSVADRLPSLDEELLLRAREALTAGNPDRAASLLDAAEDHISPDWNLLRGRAFGEQKQYREAVRCLHLAEGAYPRETAPLLERCYRELEDYRRAYEYACKRR